MSKGSQAIVGFGVLLAGLVGVFVFILVLFGDAITQGKPDWATDLIAESAAVGLMSMALIQMARSIFPVRGWFQRKGVVKWLEDGLKAFQKSFGAASSDDATPAEASSKTKTQVAEATPESILGSLVDLTSTSEVVRFFDLPIEKLCGQISVAAEHAFDRSDEHPALIGSLMGKAGSADAITYLKSKPVDEEHAAIRNRAAQRVRRNIDELQIRIAGEWKRNVWLAALVVSMILAFCIVLAADGPLARAPIQGILGGFLSTVGRDLVAVIERVRR